MKKFLLAAVVAVLLASALPGATDVSGKWSGFPIYLTLKQEGSKVAGGAGESEDDQIPFETGSIEDDRVTLKFGPMEMDLVVKGDQMSGDVHQGTNTMKIVLRRVKPRDPAAPPLTFDAATVKRAQLQNGNNGGGSSMRAAPGRLTCNNVSLKRYVVAAWGLKDYQVSGPEWMNLERYDVAATMPAGSPPNEVLSMLQTLLTERFKLVTHRETKELPVYALVVDKNGLKVKAAEGFGTSISGGPKGRTMKADITMKGLAGSLSGLVDRPVIDMTGVKGGFHFDLEWAPDENQPNPKGIDGTGAAESAAGPTIFMALHDIGLKLETRKAPVEMLVVDSAEKVPAEN